MIGFFSQVDKCGMGVYLIVSFWWNL